MESVYLETSFVSYLVSRPSRDLLIAAYQQVSREWWATRRDQFECFVSQAMIDEAAAGEPTEAAERLALVNALPILEITDETKTLARIILKSSAIPAEAVRDAVHIAVCSTNYIDYLLTWNCGTWLMRR